LPFSLFFQELRDEVPTGGYRAGHSKRTPEGLACYRLFDTTAGGMHPGTSAVKYGGVIRHYLAVTHDKPQ
jgi:hypothetical protein